MKLNYNKSFLLLFLKFENKNWLILTVNNNNIFFLPRKYSWNRHTQIFLYTLLNIYTLIEPNLLWMFAELFPVDVFKKKSFRVEEPKRCCVRFNSSFMQMGFFLLFLKNISEEEKKWDELFAFLIYGIVCCKYLVI